MAHRVRTGAGGAAGNKDACNANERTVWKSKGTNGHAQLQIAQRRGLEVEVERISLIRAELRGMPRDPEHLGTQRFRPKSQSESRCVNDLIAYRQNSPCLMPDSRQSLRKRMHAW
jgi:hypothetical protein